MDEIKPHHLQSLRSVGQHLLSSAREKGEDTAKPLAFIGLVTMALGAWTIRQAAMQMERGRGR